MKLMVSLAVLLLIAPLVALAQDVSSLSAGRTGRIEFASVTPTGPSDLVRRTAPATTVGGTPVLPASAEA